MFASLDPNLRALIAVALGAIPGALCRYYLTVGLAKWLGENFPYGTMFVNLSGSFVMGFVATLALERALISPDLRLFLSVGFLGSYTTFSTYTLDNDLFLRSGNWGMGLFYSLGSLIFGVIGLELGSFLARKLF